MFLSSRTDYNKSQFTHTVNNKNEFLVESTRGSYNKKYEVIKLNFLGTVFAKIADSFSAKERFVNWASNSKIISADKINAAMEDALKPKPIPSHVPKQQAEDLQNKTMILQKLKDPNCSDLELYQFMKNMVTGYKGTKIINDTLGDKETLREIFKNEKNKDIYVFLQEQAIIEEKDQWEAGKKNGQLDPIFHKDKLQKLNKSMLPRELYKFVMAAKISPEEIKDLGVTSFGACRNVDSFFERYKTPTIK